MKWLRGVLLAAAVALAFADTSIVVLGLPEIYGELDASVIGVSWTITTYALALGVVAAGVGLSRRRWRTPTVGTTAIGLAVFAAASVACGSADSLAALLAGRGAQGVGAALLLIGSPGLLASPGRWALAAALGATAGPAIGGFLTQAFSWRAIFFVQAPVAAAALVLVVVHRAEPSTDDAPAATRERSAALHGLAELFLAAALVGALFLSVLLVVEAWRFDPVEGALIVSPLPVGALLARLLTSHVTGAPNALAGGVLLGGGLVGLALVPSAAGALMGALLLCGLGFGLLSGEATGPAVERTVAARHLGLVVGLLLTAPLLSASLESAEDRATLGATQTLLDARLPIRTKIEAARSLRDVVYETPRGEVPDVGAAFDRSGGESDDDLSRTGARLTEGLDDVVTRAFRPSFAVAAVMALLATLFALLAARGPWHASGIAVLVVSVLAVGALIGGELAAGSRTLGDVELADPCTAPPDTYSGRGLDDTVQRLALSALNGAACELGTTREHVVLSLDGGGKLSGITWDDETLDSALEAGGLRAVDDAEDRGLPRLLAIPLRAVIRVAPLRWFLEKIDLPFGLG